MLVINCRLCGIDHEKHLRMRLVHDLPELRECVNETGRRSVTMLIKLKFDYQQQRTTILEYDHIFISIQVQQIGKQSFRPSIYYINNDSQNHSNISTHAGFCYDIICCNV